MTHRIYDIWYIYLRLLYKSIINVGKYTVRPMDGMGEDGAFPGPREGQPHRGRLQRCQCKTEFGTGSLDSTESHKVGPIRSL